MKIHEILLTEDVSRDESIKHIVDILTTQIPMLYGRLKVYADKYFKDKGTLDDDGFRMLSGGVLTKWYKADGYDYLRPALYNLYKTIPNSEAKRELGEYLKIQDHNFKLFMSDGVISLRSVAHATGNKKLLAGVDALIKARQDYISYISALEYSNDDDEDDIATAKPTKNNTIGKQNAAADSLINSVLAGLSPKVAGEIRNAISKKENKIAALQQELQKRGIKL